MPIRNSIDNPDVLKAVLNRIQAYTRQDWLDALAQYENEQPGDIALAGRRHRLPLGAKSTNLSRRRRKSA
jgi:hypothetical protein